MTARGVQAGFRSVPLMAALLVLLIALLSGCIAYEKSTEVTRVQNPDGDLIFDQIRLNETSAQWLLTTLGNPEEISRLKSGGQIYRYENLHTSHTQFQFLPAISWRHHRQQATSYWFEIQENLVVRCWSNEG